MRTVEELPPDDSVVQDDDVEARNDTSPLHSLEPAVVRVEVTEFLDDSLNHPVAVWHHGRRAAVIRGRDPESIVSNDDEVKNLSGGLASHLCSPPVRKMLSE